MKLWLAFLSWSDEQIGCFFENLTGRARWTDAGPQVWRLHLKKLSDIWKGGCKTSLWFCSQVKCVTVRTAVGFFPCCISSICVSVKAFLSPGFHLSPVLSFYIPHSLVLCPSFYKCMSVIFVCHVTFDRHIHVRSPIIACAWLHACCDQDFWFQLQTERDVVRCDEITHLSHFGLWIAFKAALLGSYMSHARGSARAPWTSSNFQFLNHTAGKFNM